MKAVFCAAGALVVFSCGPTDATSSQAPAPAVVEKVPGEADLIRLVLTPEATHRLGIQTAAVEEKQVQRRRNLGGDVVLPPGAVLTVSAPLSGTLAPPAGASVPIAGEPVEAGQPIFALMPLLPPDARVAFAASLTAAEGAVRTAEVQLAAAGVAHARAKALLEADAGSMRGLDEAVAELELSRATLAAATVTRDAVAEAIADLETGSVAPIPIHAPIAGMLRGIHAGPGQRVAAGGFLFDVFRTHTVWIRVPVYVGDLREIDLGKDAEVGDLAARPGQPSRAAVVVSAPPSASPDASTVDLFYFLDNSEGVFRPGQRVGVQLALRDQESSLVLPWAAVLHDIHGGTWVYEQVEPHTYIRRRVEVRYVSGSTAVLGRGPDVGTNVVTEGVAELFGTEFGIGK